MEQRQPRLRSASRWTCSRYARVRAVLSHARGCSGVRGRAACRDVQRRRRRNRCRCPRSSPGPTMDRSSAARHRRSPGRVARCWSALPEQCGRWRVRSRRVVDDPAPDGRIRRRSGGGDGSLRPAIPVPRRDQDRREPTDAGGATDRERRAARCRRWSAHRQAALAAPIRSMRRSAALPTGLFTALSACPTSPRSSRAIRCCSSSRVDQPRREPLQIAGDALFAIVLLQESPPSIAACCDTSQPITRLMPSATPNTVQT